MNQPSNEQEAFLRGQRTGFLATLRARGGPQLTLIAYDFDGKDIVISTRAMRAKAKNVRRRPDVSLGVTDGRGYLTVYGKARVVDDWDEVFRLHKERLGRIRSQPESDAALTERLRSEERVVIVLTPEGYVSG